MLKRKQYIIFSKILDNHFITARDYNGKHTHRGLRLILSKERELFKAIETMNLATLSIEESTCWSYDNKKTPDLVDFNIIKGILKDYCRT